MQDKSLNSTPRVVFAHGKESGPWGSKIQHLALIAGEYGFSVESLNYQGMNDPGERVQHLLSHQLSGSPLVLVGSSMGGYVSAMACREMRPDALFLMAPALYMDGYPGDPEGCPDDTVVVHGWQDDIVPVEVSIDFARPRRASLHLVKDGHRLKDSLDFMGLCLGRQLQRCLSTSQRQT